jgi:hypothetical protein
MQMQYKLKHRISAALMAGAMCCTMIPAASADEIATPETAEVAAAEATNQVEQPTASGGGLSVEEIQSRMYPSLPQTATGYYLDSTGLPVLTGETKISIEGWGDEDYSDYDADSTIQVALDEALLNTDSATASFPRMEGEDYAIVPISIQVLYPANGGSADITLPDNVELLGYSFTSGDLCAATEEERQRQLHYDFSEVTASVTGIYVKATEDFSVTLTYTDSEKSLTKALHVTLDDSAPFPGILQDRFAQEAQPAFCSADAGVAAYAGLQVTQCVYTSVGWMNYLGGQPALCADSGKWAWGPGATYANKYPPVANYSSAGSVWVLASFFGKGWTADQATMWAQGFNSGAPSAVSACAVEDATDNNAYITYNILDEELEGYLQLVKIDIETGKPVKIADTAFNLYYIAEDGRETLVEMNDPKSGNAWAKTSTFYTDSNGEMKTPEKLPLGRYRIVEIEGPRGYFNDRQYNVVFELTSDRVYQVSGGSADGMDDYVITENYYNHETLGQIKIRKIGNVLTGYENGQFVYESDNLANATYEIHAQGDIPTPDNQGTLWYADGDLVATVTTAEDGQVDEVRFSPTRTTATYDFLKVTHDGTKGEVTITLPLGTYTISEVQAPYGFVHTDHTYTVVLDWDNQYNDLVLAKAVTDHTQDGDVIYDYSIINVGNASAEQMEKQILVFENARVLPVVEEGKVGVGLYKLDRDTCDLTDEAPYSDGCKTRASLLNGGSNRADIPADAKMVAGSIYELYTADDIYSISGELLAAADTLLGTATTDQNGLAYFDVDVPVRGEHYGSSDAHDWTTNSGRYYLREISVPDGYLIEQSVIPVEFTYENQFIAWQIVDCLHSDKQTTVEIDKRAFASDSDTTFALPGATLTVTDWNGNVVDSWESSDTAHVIRGLHLSHDFAGNRDTTKIYTLSETRPADGYTTARSIQFRLEQATGDNSYLQETTVWVLHESEDAEYQSGSIISPTAFSDDSVATIPAKLRAFWDKLLGKNPDADGVVIANWYCVNGMLVVNFTDAANNRAIAKCLRESDFSDLTFDKVYLNGAVAHAFFADKQVAEKPADTDITYSASWILLKDSDGFSQAVTMLDAPTRVKISKTDITTHEEIPGATLRVLDTDGKIMDEWVSADTPHYMEAVLIAGKTYTLEETLVPNGSGYVPATSIQFTVEDDGKVQHVFMQDDYTKVQISKTDIATGKEISGAKLKITDADGKAIAEWVTDGTPHYIERIPMDTYTLTEMMAPTEQGYVRAESVTFEVGPTGDIQRVEMKDDFTKVEISKADMTDGRELPGAKLKITDASGSTIAEWETNGHPHRIERLKPGEYTLTETAAPAGYLLSEEVCFTVLETGKIQKVTMYDAPAHSLILTKRDIATNAKLADARLTIRDAYGTTIDRWTTTDGDHAIRVLPECSAAKDPHKNLLLLSDDTSEHVYTMVEELAPNSYLVAESITFKVMQMNDDLVVFVWQDGGWQKSSEGYLAMYDERTDTPVPLMKTFPQTGSIL